MPQAECRVLGEPSHSEVKWQKKVHTPHTSTLKNRSGALQHKVLLTITIYHGEAKAAQISFPVVFAFREFIQCETCKLIRNASFRMTPFKCPLSAI